MQIRCPHCRQPIELVDDNPTADVACSSCGSSFNLASDAETNLDDGTSARTLGHYRLLNCLGLGAFGSVWKAQDTELDRTVAIKIPRDDRMTATDTDRFLREARAAAQVRHPNIVSVHEVGREEGRIYIASDLVEGASLDEWIEAHPLSVREAVELCAKVATALHHAHEAGIVHRDLKPQNILMDMDGEPHITDFGLAKRDAGEITMTVEGAIMGTPAYMSPEQARGEAHQADRRSDVYSLGVMLFRLLTGELPFRGRSQMLIVQILKDEPPAPRKLDAKIPRDIETICLKCLEKDAGRRYQTSADLAADLDRWLTGHAITARRVGRLERTWRWSRRNAAVSSLCAVVALVAMIGFAAVMWQWRQTVGQRDRAEGALKARNRALKAETEARRDESHAKEAATKMAAANARQLADAYVSNGVRLIDRGDSSAALPWLASALRLDLEDSERQLIHRTRIAAALRSCPKPVQMWFSDAAVRHAEFSPDGGRVVIAGEDRTARVWDVRTGEPVTPPLEHPGTVLSASFDHSGHRLVTASQGGQARIWNLDSAELSLPPLDTPSDCSLARFNSDGTRVLTVTRGDSARLWGADTGKPITPAIRRTFHAAFSPDGSQWITCGHSEPRMQLWDATSGNVLFSIRNDDRIDFASFSRDGHRAVLSLYNSSNTPGAAFVFDFVTKHMVGQPLRHTRPIQFAGFSPNGRYVVTASADKTARLWETSSGKPQAEADAIQHEGQVSRAVFSPDSQLVATASDDGVVRLWEVASSQELCSPLYHQDAITSVEFASGGRSLLTASLDGSTRIWDLAAAMIPHTAVQHDTHVNHVVFDEDGSFASATSRSVRYWSATGDTARPEFRPEARIGTLIENPDGPRALTTHDSEVRVWNVRTGEPVGPVLRNEQIPEADAYLNRDGVHVVIWTKRPTADEVHVRVVNAETGAQVSSDIVVEAGVNGVALSEDARYLALASSRRDGTKSRHAVRVLETASGHDVTPMLQHSGYIRGITFAPDGRAVATACMDRTARLWAIPSGNPMARPLKHRYLLESASFDATGSRLLTFTGYVMDDFGPGEARVWNVGRGDPATPILKHDNPIREAGFGYGGRFVLTASRDKTARVWDAATGHAMTPPLTHQSPVDCIAMSRDHLSVATGSWNGIVRAWNLTPVTLDVDEIERAATLISARTVNENGELNPASMDELRQAWSRYLPIREHLQCSESQRSVWLWNQIHRNAEAGQWKHVVEQLRNLDENKWLNPKLLRQAAWFLVKLPNVDAEDYEFALRIATRARAQPSFSQRLTLGAAQFRTGDLTAALQTLTSLEDDLKSSDPYAVAYIAMIEHELGNGDRAQSRLKQLRDLVRTTDLNLDEEFKQLMQEAAAAIESGGEPKEDR